MENGDFRTQKLKFRVPDTSLHIPAQNLMGTYLSLTHFFSSFQAEKSTPTLTLSHEELIHIRSALSRNKLESLCDPDLKAQIEKGNICFHCTKTKFNIFFHRKQQCELCQRTVCTRCISKVRDISYNYFLH